MRRTMLIAVLMTAALGCKKDKKDAKNGGPDVSPPPATKYVSSVGGSNPVNPNQSGNLTVTGGQGAIQSPRMAAARTVNDVQLQQLHLSMSQTFLLDNRVPDINEIMQEARQNSQLFPLLKEEVIILTGTKNGNAVWAYTQYPQRSGNHYVIVSSGRVEMSPEDLHKRLEQEGSPIKMAK